MSSPNFLEVLRKTRTLYKKWPEELDQVGEPHMFTICCSVIAQLGLLQGSLVGLGGGIRVVRSAEKNRMNPIGGMLLRGVILVTGIHEKFVHLL